MKRFLQGLLILGFCWTWVFTTSVFADADKTTLTALRDEVNAVIADQTANSTYENDSYTAFESGLTALGGVPAIDAMIADPLAVQEDVNQMSADLQSLLDGLCTADTFDAVMLSYLTEKTRPTAPYTLRSIQLFQDELDRIEAILNEPTSGEVAIAALEGDIDNAPNLLVLLGDKTDLQAAYNQAESILLDGSTYIPSTLNLFTTRYNTIDDELMASIGFTKSQVLNNTDASAPEVEATLLKINEALAFLILRPDKTTLQNNYDQATSMDLLVYTLTSRTAFLNGLTNIDTVLEDDEALQADVDQALLDLADLYNLLVLKGDPTTLQAEIDALSEIDFDLYTPNSVDEFDLEIARIEAAMNDEDTDQTMMSTLESDFTTAMLLLIERAEKDSLDTLNNQAIVAYYEEKILYTASSYALFKQAVMDYGTYLHVNTVLADLNVSQADVDLLATQIEDALAFLVLRVDNALLLEDYQQLESLDRTLYTPNSLTAFDTLMNQLYQTMTGDDLSQEVYDSVQASLLTVTDLLVLKANQTALQAKVDEYLLLNPEHYSASSYGILSQGLVNASAILLNLNATQEEVDSELLALEASYDALMPPIGLITIMEGEVYDFSALIPLGNNTILSTESSDGTVLLITGATEVKGIAFGHVSVTVTLSNGTVETISFLVKSTIKTGTLVFSIGVPLVSIGGAFAMMYLRPEHLQFLKKLRFWKKKGA
ncbi:MAG: hypothetical protein PHP32_05205 [Candidatus Izemoplasmatales bacterium]|nr:hypothetical protein [Candidatus Izemoplasmatales bacterium]